MREIDIDIDVGKIDYKTFADWCNKVGLENKVDPKFVFKNGDWSLTRTRLPEDMAVLFRLEFEI